MYEIETKKRKNKSIEDIFNDLHIELRAVAGQRSSSDLCFATKFIKIYDP